jgi:hypothetical protein
MSGSAILVCILGIIVIAFFLNFLSGQPFFEGLITSIVLIIVFLMASPLIVRYKDIAHTKINMKKIKASIELYYNDINDLPSDLNRLDYLITSINPKTSKPYLSEDYMYDTWGRPIEYSIEDKNHLSYMLISHGSDEGDAKDDIVIKETVGMEQ